MDYLPKLVGEPEPGRVYLLKSPSRNLFPIIFNAACERWEWADGSRYHGVLSPLYGPLPEFESEPVRCIVQGSVGQIFEGKRIGDRVVKFRGHARGDWNKVDDPHIFRVLIPNVDVEATVAT